ncbi:aromatic ring-hydroxylating oxygenase subunit alpha [Aquabacterium sp.]|uniref:aromatic ring-hydroxylating oxygenase subunit alpha n=1 Tax=Aquabacterium sp. TaxID=1872578 RepID=UPI002C6ED6A8|nr:aromatic ring-hydroxylating dioxygenase subunit alpha [Aquabacterium sp.]HSW05574.1 aromatic ring-hydroxylating dioxygenase subunit alpha [Aquabacterium sp.]
MTHDMTHYTIDPDVTTAGTLDASFYRDEAAYALARERIFARSWQWIGDTADVAEPGSLSPRELVAGGLDEPLLLARDGAGVLRCLSNVCTHRGNLLVPAPCRSEQIRCGYHSRRFDLQGRMLFMPEFQQAKNFPSPNDNLPEVPLALFHDQAFAAVQPVAPLAAFLGDIEARLQGLPWDRLQPDPSRSRDYSFDAHWALYVENYLEGLHIPFLHAGLMETLDFGQYSYELHRYANLQLALAKDGEPAFDLPHGSPDQGRRIAAYYYWVFPNLMLNFYPWGLSVNLVQPLGPMRTRVLFRSYVLDASQLGRGAGGDLHRVEMEDEAVVLTVQRGVRSRFYRGGRYSPTREQGVHHFHRLIAEFMGSAPPACAAP